ncbi:MAG: prolyl-tRNA synthetase associated domain-containing protein [Acidobacteriota bacterium]|nr:prolyl-tRNA synthetase associated domain-containing protein [Acidobacteriota bacterium]
MTPPDAEAKVLRALEDLGIAYVRHEHPPVFTVEEAERHWRNVPGAHCKNLFLRNNKGNRHYLVIVEASKRVDLKDLTRKLKEDRLSFGSPQRLGRYLGIEPGSVSPFALINDPNKEVRVVVDRGLKSSGHVSFHPNVNTATLSISFPDFEKFLGSCGHKTEFLEI